MGQIAIYKCKNCGNEFEASEGGGFTIIEHRCVDCDQIKAVASDQMVDPEKYKPPPKKKIGKCKKCGGKLKDDLRPMRQKCKSRDVEEREVRVLYD